MQIDCTLSINRSLTNSHRTGAVETMSWLCFTESKITALGTLTFRLPKMDQAPCVGCAAQESAEQRSRGPPAFKKASRPATEDAEAEHLRL